jgi:hypothetical protein
MKISFTCFNLSAALASLPQAVVKNTGLGFKASHAAVSPIVHPILDFFEYPWKTATLQQDATAFL